MRTSVPSWSKIGKTCYSNLWTVPNTYSNCIIYDYLNIIISAYSRFASWSPSTTTDNPFKYKINSGKETSFPVIEVNGPPIKLPSFSVSSNFKVFSENDKENKMQMYSDIEQRTGSSSDGILDEENFDLNFFQQR